MNSSRPLRTVARPFVTGLVALLPIGLTALIVGWLVTYITKWLGPGSVIGSMLKRIGWNIGSTETGAYLGGVLFTVLLIYGIGLVVEYGLKGRWERMIDALVSRVPLIRTVYDAAKKITHMIEPHDSVEMQSMTPVMCSFGGQNGTSFPAFMPTSETVDIQGTAYHVVMIPTAPVPFGGAILCVPAEWVTELDCGIDGLLNIYMSMGTTMPEFLKPASSA